MSLADKDKREGVSIVAHLHDLGFDIYATEGTARALKAVGVPVRTVAKVGEGRPDVVDYIVQGKVSLVVNTHSATQNPRVSKRHFLPPHAQWRGVPLNFEDRRTVGYRIRTAALKHRVPYITTLSALRVAVAAIRRQKTRTGIVEVEKLV